jgi:hypothetical protein
VLTSLSHACKLATQTKPTTNATAKIQGKPTEGKRTNHRKPRISAIADMEETLSSKTITNIRSQVEHNAHGNPTALIIGYGENWICPAAKIQRTMTHTHTHNSYHDWRKTRNYIIMPLFGYGVKTNYSA